MTTYEITGNVTAGGSVQAKVGVGGGGGGGGAVNSVNGKTGDVVLTASDVGALPDTTPIPAAYDDTALKARVGAVEEDVSELNENKADKTELESLERKHKILSATLVTGATSLTFTDSSITASSLISVYTEKWGVMPSDVTQTGGSVLLTFEAQSADIAVKVEVQ